MQSSMYPNIVYLKNNSLTFLGTVIAQQQKLNILHPSNPLNIHYANMTSKLFNQIKIPKQTLWIGKIPSTQIIRVYFSEPYQYPASECCYKPVIIQVESDRSGFVLCSKCSKELIKFVKAGKGGQQQMFKVIQKQAKNRKDELKSLLTSLKFRGKKLRNNFLINQTINQNQNDLIVEINEQRVINQKNINTESDLTPYLLQLKNIVNDIFA